MSLALHVALFTSGTTGTASMGMTVWPIASLRPGSFGIRFHKTVKDQVVEIALERPEQSSRELAWYITDTYGYYISESSVYRILKSHDLVTSPAYILISASDHFEESDQGGT